jgi:hypothetical protein
VIDLQPRQFDAESCNVLANFAEVVVREIEKEKLRVLFFAQILFPITRVKGIHIFNR